MSTLQQLKRGVSNAWDSLVDGWQKLYQQASGAITRFWPGSNDREEQQALARRSAGWGVMAAEVFDDGEKLVVRLEAPGMERDDFDLQVTENYLVVRGEKHFERENKEGRYHITERAYGSFERAIPLPEAVNADQAKAKYKHGVLHIELPKAESHRRRTIEIQSV